MIRQFKSNQTYVAVQWLGNNVQEIYRFWLDFGKYWGYRVIAGNDLEISGNDLCRERGFDSEEVQAEKGDWIVVNPNKNFFVVGDDYVRKYFEPAEDLVTN